MVVVNVVATVHCLHLFFSNGYHAMPKRSMAVVDVAAAHFLHLMQIRESHGDLINIEGGKRV